MPQGDEAVLPAASRRLQSFPTARARPSDVAAPQRLTIPHAFAAFIGCYLLAWMLEPLIGHLAIPADNLEQLDWAGRLAWGYDKHPPFPSFVLWCVQHVIPASVALTYAMGAACVAVMLAVVYRLAHELLGLHRALLALLLVTAITYYTQRLHFYNHNTALLAMSALAVLQAWRVAQQPTAGRWLVLGLVWALGLLSKYQMVLTIAANLCFLASLRPLDVRRTLQGGALAGLACAVVLSPHLYWLATHSGTSLGYAQHMLTTDLSLTRRLRELSSFDLHQVGRLILPALVIVLALRLQRGTARVSLPAPTTDAARLLAIHAWVPFIVMNALALFGGVELMMHWGTAFLWMMPLWFLSTLRGGSFAMRLALPEALTAAAVLQLGTFTVGVLRGWL